MRAERWRDRVFFSGMAVAIAAIVFTGFAPTFYLRDFADRPLSRLVLGHGILFSTWIVLLIAQTSLVAAGRTDLHRRLGVAGAATAGLMLFVGPLTALVAARRDFPAQGAPALEFLIVPLSDMVVFGTLVALAFLWRRRGETHKRLMLLATIALLPAPVGRLPIDVIREGASFPTFAFADVPLFGCLAYDLVARRRLHPAFLGGGLFILASQPLRMALGDTQAWHSVARWLVG